MRPKRLLVTLLTIAAAHILWLQSAFCQQTYSSWSPDILGDGLEMRYVKHHDDYSGPVQSTIIRKLCENDSVSRGILYVHGFNDYFFNSEMADEFVDHGYDFYAVDLRKYGRSIIDGQHMFEARNLKEYFPDIDSALVTMKQSGLKEIVMMGHSTGGLIASYYLANKANPVNIDALILNSPFLDWNLGKIEWMVPAVSTVGYVFPDFPVPQSKSTAYGESLLKSHKGEWDYDTRWKLMQSPTVTAGWVRAINGAQDYLHSGGHKINIPILLMYSSKSLTVDYWTPQCQSADIVLDAGDIKKYGLLLGSNVTCVKVPGGLHDLLLSRKTIRQPLYNEIFSWLNKHLRQT